MTLLRVLVTAAQITSGFGGRFRVRVRHMQRRSRGLIAAGLGLVLTVGTCVVPVAAVAGVAAAVVAASVATAGPAKAQSGPPVLVLLQNGETTAPESTLLQNAGYAVTQATPSTWAGMSASQFESYAALVIGDPSSGGSCSTTIPTTSTLGTAWQGAVNGNLAVLGTAPALPGTTAANTLITDAAKYAAAGFNSANSGTPTSGTGLYESLNCEYSTAAAGTSVPLLAGVEGIGTAGGLTVQGGLSCSDAGTVNAWEADKAGTFGGFTSSSLVPSDWSPGCPVKEAFDSWPALFTPVGYDAASDAAAKFTASDGVTGQPYLLLGAPVSAATAALAPSAGGEVLAGTTAGGTSNPAAPGVSQASAGDPVNTENGDFTQAATDVSIPVFGPALGFSRTYDADVAQQQTKAGTPGPMGYGWTDNWATSLSTVSPTPGDIYTAGGLRTNNGNGGAAAASVLHKPGDTYVDGSGDVYIADTYDNRIQEIAGSTGTQWGISMTAGDVYTVAGSPQGYFPHGTGTANGTPAAQTLLNHPTGVTANSSGLYIADTGDCRVVEIAAASQTQWNITMTADDEYTIAGTTGTCGTSGDGGVATSAELNLPTSIHLGAGSHTGDLYIADTGNNRIQEIAATAETQWGKSMSANDIYTVAGSSSGASGMSSNGTAAGSTLLNAPAGVTIDGNGDMLIADTNNCRIAEIPASSGTYWGITGMTGGDLYDVAGRGGSTNCTIGNDGKSQLQSNLNYPASVRDPNGNMYIADTANNRVQEVAGSAHTEWGQSMTADFIYTIAGNSAGTGGNSGNGGTGTSAYLSAPGAVWVDSTGNLYVSDTANNALRKLSTSTDIISALAGTGYTLLNAGDGGPAVLASLLSPQSVASDSHGDIFIADTANNRVQEIAASSHTQFGIAMTAGDIYTVAGSSYGQSGYAGDGGLATSALLFAPASVAVDSSGNLYIADESNSLIRKVSASTGDISTIVGTPGEQGYYGDGGPATSAVLGLPDAVAVDSAGDVFLADSENDLIQEVPATSGTHYGIAMTAGDIYAIAGVPQETGDSGDGGPGSSALLNGPEGLAVDTAGNVYLSDTSNEQVREVAAATGTQWAKAMTAGDIYTIAGNTSGTGGNTGDGGPAASAELDFPVQIALDTAGDLYIADAGNNRIREIAAASGTQQGQSMTAGDIYNVAGNASGTSGFAGNGGPATASLMFQPFGIGTDPAGDLFLLQSGPSWAAGQIQEVTATATSAIPPAPGQTSSVSPAPGGITITQPDGSQVTFYGQSGGCASPYIAAGQYCVLPQFTGVNLTDNTGNQTYTYTPAPGADTSTYAWAGHLISQADTAGNTLTATYNSPAPGSGNCPSTAASCETVTAANGRALVIGSNSSGLVTSVTDPMSRTWTYAYNSSSQLTTVTDPMTNKTTYTYGQGSTGNPLLASDLLSITGPNAQPGGPDAGDATVNVYDNLGRVTSQTDPMGFKTTFNYCVNLAAGDCMDPATGTGYVTTTDPDGNTTVDDYTQGTLAAETKTTASTVTSENDYNPLTTAGGNNGGTLLDATTTDADGNTTTNAFNTSGATTSATSPSADGPATTTTGYTTQDNSNCDGTAEASSSSTCIQDTGPTPVAPGGVITPPSSAPPEGLTYTLYDTDGNGLYATTGVYEPGSSSASYLQTTYQLFNGNSVTLNGNNINCTARAPSPSLPCAKINADGVVTQFGYNSAGDLTSSATPDGNGTQIATTTYGYDGDGEQTSTTAPDGNLSGANAGNYTIVTAFNSDGQKTSVTQAGGTGATITPRTTYYGYDADNNPTTVKDARGYTTTTTYNPDDKATLVTNPDGNAILTCYDGDGNTAQTVPSVGVAAGSLTPTSCPTSYPSGYSDRLASDATTYTYNADASEITTTTPGPAGQSGYETTTYAYDGDGNLIQTTAPPATNGGPNQVTVDTYNSAGQMASETTGYGTSVASTTTYCYDPDGDQTAVVAPDGDVSGTAPCQTSSPWTVSSSSNPTQAAYQTTYSYDSGSEQVSTTTPATAAAPNGATTTSTYDPAGNMLTSTDPDGVTTTYTYTPTNLKATVSYSGSSAHSVSYSYDADGSKTGMTDATGSSSYIYDPFGELTSANNGANQTTGYGYTPDGQVASITYPLPSGATWATSSTASYGYDNADLLTSVTDFNGNKISIINTADGLPSSRSLGSSGDTIATSYDPTDSPSSIALKNSSSTLQSFTYSDGPAVDISSETDSPSPPTSPATYSYDAQGRVTSMTPGTGSQLSYSFDASGNLVSDAGASATYDHASELTSSTLSGTNQNFTYSADGEELNVTAAGSTVASGTWNGARELSAYSDSAGDLTAATYDGNGLRASSTSNPSGGTATSQQYVWDTIPQTPVLLMDSIHAYIYAGSGTPAEQVNLSTGTITYLVADLLGSVRGAVNASGTLTGTTSYDAWGNPLTAGGLSSATPFGFAGGYTDPTGFLYLIDRYYDPVLGQFISADPDVMQTQEPYGYAGGNPVSTTDPSGAMPIPVGGGGTDLDLPIFGGACHNNHTWCGWAFTFLAGNVVDGKITAEDYGAIYLDVSPGPAGSSIAVKPRGKVMIPDEVIRDMSIDTEVACGQALGTICASNLSFFRKWAPFTINFRNEKRLSGRRFVYLFELETTLAQTGSEDVLEGRTGVGNCERTGYTCTFKPA
jgi:RHS repeat-associated protein